MDDRRRSRLRAAASLAALAVAAGATLATSSVAGPSVDFASGPVTLRLEPGHPAAFQRFVVHVDAEAIAGGPRIEASVRLDRVDGSAHLVVTTARPGGAAVAPSGQPLAAGEPWEADVASGYGGTALPMDCSAAGPCERAFWVVAQMDEGSEQTAAADWHVDVRLEFSSGFPAGPGGHVAVEEPAQVTGPAPQLTASTPGESVTLGPQRPVAARLVEVTLGANGIRGDGEPSAAMSFTATPSRTTGYISSSEYAFAVYPVGDGTTTAPAALPEPVASGADPFADCPRGAPCVRRFVAAMSWLQGEDLTIDWQVSVRRVGLASAWATPAELSVRVARAFDVASDARPRVLHAEGDAITNDPNALRFLLRTASASDDALVRSLPVPGRIRFRAVLSGAGASASPAPYADVEIVTDVGTSPNAGNGFQMPFDAGTSDLTANAFAGCSIGTSCPGLRIATTSRIESSSPVPHLEFHWTLDVAVYSFADVPVTVEMIGAGS